MAGLKESRTVPVELTSESSISKNLSALSVLKNLLDDEKFRTGLLKPTSANNEKVDVQSLLSLVEDILGEATATVYSVATNTHLKVAQSQGKNWSALVRSCAPLSSTINKVCCQITCEALHAENVSKIVQSLFSKLEDYSWDAKAVVTLLAFSVYYAENWRLTQIGESDKLLSLVSMLKGFSELSGASNNQRVEKFKALNDVIKWTLEITKRIVAYQTNRKHLDQCPIDLEANFYYVILTVLFCSVQFSGMINTSAELLERDLYSFEEHARKKFETLEKNVREQEQTIFLDLKKLLIECTCVVNVLSRFFCINTTMEMTYQKAKKDQKNMDVLKGKNVLLLISDLKLSNEDLETISSIYTELHKSSYEILWIPIVEEQSDNARDQYEDQRRQMEWYSLKTMAIISKVTLKVMMEEWGLKRGTTTVVLLNEKGKVENKNAMALIRIWGWKASPFTESKGYELWKQQGLNWFKLLIEKIMPSNDRFMQSTTKKPIFLYGSAEDKKETQLSEGDLKIINTHCISLNVKEIEDLFCTCLESFIYSKMQTNSNVYESLTHDLLEVYNNYKQRGGSVILARGSTVVINTSMAAAAKVLSNYKSWCASITEEWTFEKAFKKQHDEPGFIEQPRCHHFGIPFMVGNIPDYVRCTKCPGTMEVTVTYKCCHGKH